MAEPMPVEKEEEEVVQIELLDQEEKEGAPTVEVVQAPEKSDETEIASYSESVKKRINKLTYKIKEAERREAAALDYAKNVQLQLNRTEVNLSQKDKNLYDEYSARVASQLATAESQYKKAHEVGDADQMLAAQKEVATLAVELESLNRVKPTRAVRQDQQVAQQPQQPQQVAQPQPIQAPAAPDPKAQEWAKQNKWFGTDLAMTTSAFAFHRQLVETEGFDPSTDEYYQEVDRRMSDSFPHKLGRVAQNVQIVAGASRGARGRAGKGRTVRLTPSQVAIAKRLGVPLEEYAKHVKQE